MDTPTMECAGMPMPLTRSEQSMADAIDALYAAGFVSDGHTREEIVRIPTKNSPLLGRSGGELAKLGGRQRFAQANTSLKATVGKRTVSVYRVNDQGLTGVTGIASFDTSDIARLRQVLQAHAGPHN